MGDAPSLGRQLWALACRHAGFILVCFAMLALLWLVENLLDGQITELDNMAYWLVVQHMRRDWLTPIMTTITDLAMPVTLVVVLVVVAAFAPGQRPGFCAMLNLGLVVVLNEVLKLLVHRPRPDGYRLVSEVGYSFPSGHAMVSMAFYGLLVWLIWRYERDRVWRVLFCLFFGCVIAGVGISRIYLGVHYASDVLAGYCVSLIWLVLFTKVVTPLFMPEPVNPPLFSSPPKEGEPPSAS